VGHEVSRGPRDTASERPRIGGPAPRRDGQQLQQQTADQHHDGEREQRAGRAEQHAHPGDDRRSRDPREVVAQRVDREPAGVVAGHRLVDPGGEPADEHRDHAARREQRDDHDRERHLAEEGREGQRGGHHDRGPEHEPLRRRDRVRERPDHGRGDDARRVQHRDQQAADGDAVEPRRGGQREGDAGAVRDEPDGDGSREVHRLRSPPGHASTLAAAS
jgi:hypothetical protein